MIKEVYLVLKKSCFKSSVTHSCVGDYVKLYWQSFVCDFISNIKHVAPYESY